MNLIAELQSALDRAAADISGTSGLTERTRAVHDAVEELASRYAGAVGCGYGTKFEEPCDGGKILVVHRTGGKPPRALGQFLFDQCWLMHHCTGDEDNSDCFAETGERKNGYPIRCELAMESEWPSPSNDATGDDPMYDDFCKLVMARAKTKLFVFACSDLHKKDSFRRLRTCLISCEQQERDERYLTSCLSRDRLRFDHRVFDGTGNPI